MSREELYALRKEHGPHSQIGLICSKWIEQIDNLQGAGELQRANLLKAVELSERDLRRLLHANQ